MGKNYSGGGGGEWHKKQGKKNNAEASTAYSAPTAGLTKVLFAFGTTKDVASFPATKNKLAQHVGTQSWPGAAVAPRAIEDMIDLEMNKQDWPKLEKNGKDWDINDPLFRVEYEDYALNSKEYQVQ